MTPTTIGHVVQIKGSVEVRAVDGTIKLLSLGDRVHDGEVVTTATGADLTIDFLNGKRLVLGESSQALLDETVHRAHEFGAEELQAEVAQMQLALLDGTLDINDLEPTAAGPDDQTEASRASALGAGVVFTREGREGHVDSRGTDFATSSDTAPGLAELGSDPLVVTEREPEPEPIGAIPNTPSVVTGLWSGDLLEGNLGDIATASGTLAISGSDPDNPPSFPAGLTPGRYGTLELVGENWTYSLDQTRVQDLDAGDLVTDVLRMVATDGTVQDITIAIAGTDDVPVVAGAFAGSVVEGDPGDMASATGSITITDVDEDDAPEFADAVIAGSFGSLTLVGGTWTYFLNQDAVQSLESGDTVSDVIRITATDGTTRDIAISIAGSDDAATVIGTFVGSVAEADPGDIVTATGTLSIDDPDAGDSPVFENSSVTGNYGTLNLVGGSWTYTLDQTSVSGAFREQAPAEAERSRRGRQPARAIRSS